MLESLPFVLIGLSAGLLAMPESILAIPQFRFGNVRLFKRGGLWFFRFGRLSGSVCIAKH